MLSPRGGNAPNVVPDFAEVYYYARHLTRREVKLEMFLTVLLTLPKVLLLGTGTTMDYEMIGVELMSLLHIETLQKRVHKNLETSRRLFLL